MYLADIFSKYNLRVREMHVAALVIATKCLRTYP